MRENILNSITIFKNKQTNDIIPITEKTLLFESSKYSSTKQNIWHVIINNIKLKKTSEYLIGYKCLTCQQENLVSTTQFLRRIRECKKGCYLCNNIGNYNELKKILDLTELPINTRPNKKEEKTYIEMHKYSLEEFEKYPDQYKNSYLLSHLNNDDYNRIKKNIISFSNGKLTDINNYEFWSIYKVNNQMNFSSVMYDKINKIIFKSNQPIMKCDNCNNNWRCKSIEQFKNSHKIFCQSCKLCNQTLKIRIIKNINNDPIMYQSKLELKFIEWCKSNNFVVKNGPNVDYIFNDSKHKYRVDFQVNDILIEIKDYHIWHNNQVKSGLWDIKVNAVNNYIKENKLNKYLFITPKNWNEQIKLIK
jgi:hypothetical protein